MRLLFVFLYRYNNSVTPLEWFCYQIVGDH